VVHVGHRGWCVAVFGDAAALLDGGFDPLDPGVESSGSAEVEDFGGAAEDGVDDAGLADHDGGVEAAGLGKRGGGVAADVLGEGVSESLVGGFALIQEARGGAVSGCGEGEEGLLEAGAGEAVEVEVAGDPAAGGVPDAEPVGVLGVAFLLLEELGEVGVGEVGGEDLEDRLREPSECPRVEAAEDRVGLFGVDPATVRGG